MLMVSFDRRSTYKCGAESLKLSSFTGYQLGENPAPPCHTYCRQPSIYSISATSLLTVSTTLPGIMSYDQPSSATTSIVQGCGSRDSHVSLVTFNIDGQPIGDNAASLSTMIRRSVKNNIPPSFDKWSNVPNVMKEKVWDIVTNKYEIPIDNKEWVLMKANECWRNRKSKLKRGIYSKYHIDADRKKNVPKFVKKEDWDSFIDMCSTYAAQEKSKLGKAARQAMRCPHTFGRKGQARVADELEITRTDVWLETHTKKDGSASCEEAVRQDSSRQEAQSNQATTDQSSSPLLKLLHLTKNTCVAYGRQSNASAEESSWKRIILDEIVDGNVDLINGQGKMEDLTLGDAIDWPEFRIISI